MSLSRVLAASVAVLASIVALEAGAIRRQPVHFEPGASSATLRGTIEGDETVDYVLGARRGQTMSVALKTGHGATSFNVLPPGSDAAIAIGSVVGDAWSGALPADGEYRVRVFMMRSAARRNETGSYTLTIAITGQAASSTEKPASAPGSAGDAKVPGTPYHATGKVPCSFGTAAPTSMAHEVQCSFGVIRHGGGKAEIHLADPGFDVTLHAGDLRVLRFADGTVTSANPKDEVTFQKRGDLWTVSVNGVQHYLVPEAAILGG